MGRGGRRSGRAAGMAVLLCALQGPACATSIVVDDGFLMHSERGYRIDAPGPEWLRISVEGADLAFRGPGRSSMSMLSRCRAPLADPRILARHLVVGISDRALLAEGEVELAGRRGWSRTYRTVVDGEPRFLKSVTVVAGRCIYDWLLVVPEELPEVERSFDRWWTSAQLPDGGEPDGASR